MIPKHELRQMYHNDQMSMPKISDKINVSISTVCRWMKFYGIESRSCSEAQTINSIKLSKKELEKMYWIDKMSLTEISKKIGVTQPTISNWMRTYNIKPRQNSYFTGEKNGNWQGGISGGKYCYRFNNLFKEAVRERDNYTCQLCGFEQNGEKLSVHHIHYDKENCWPDVVALCRSCNVKVNGNRNYWEEYFENLLVKRELFCWSLSQEA